MGETGQIYIKDRVGVFGSADGAPPEIIDTTTRLGEALARRNVIIVTGACPGVPYQVASAAYRYNQTEIWGYSSARNRREHDEETPPGDDNRIYPKLLYVPSRIANLDDSLWNLSTRQKFRNVTSTANCDAGIIVAGRIGTLNEYTCLFDMGKVIGVLLGTGGTADLVQDLQARLSKPSRAVVLYSDSPEELVEMTIQQLRVRDQVLLS